MNQARYIKAGSFIDGSGGPARRNVYLAVKDGIIAAIGPAADLASKNPASVVDLTRCIIVPPLVDCSVSLTRSPSVDRKVRLAAEEAGLAEKTALVLQHIRYCHSHGVLGIADCDDSLGLVKHLQEAGPEKISIDIRSSGRLCRTGKDCPAETEPDVDFLKMVYAEIANSHDAPASGVSLKALQAVLRGKGNKKAVVVANGERQVREVLAAGCDAIEQGYSMGGNNLRKMAETDVLWIPNLLLAKTGLDSATSGGEVMCRFSARYVAPGRADPGAETFWKKMLAEQLEQLSLARELGVKTALGTGAGSIGILHGESMVEEMKLFIKAGWSVEETIRSASETGAGFFGFKNLGPLAVGRKATFLVARATLQQLPRKLAYLQNIYVGGRKWKGGN